MYNLYTDKSEKFQCKIELEGAKSSEARLILESEHINLMFKGKIKDGICEINISKLRNLLHENATGKLKLEVIADGDAYFCPWFSDFKVLTSRKVTVEVLNKQKQIIKESIKPSIKVSNINQSQNNGAIKDIVALLKEYKIAKKDIISTNKVLLPILETYKKNIKNTDPFNIFIDKIKNSY